MQTGYVFYTLKRSIQAQGTGSCIVGPFNSITPRSIAGLAPAPYLGEYRHGRPVDPKGARIGDAGDKLRRCVWERREGGGVLATGVNFCYELGCTQLDVSVYKAGRQDRLYTTPYLVVYDVSGREHGWFYWWYRGGDPMTYEVEFMEAGGRYSLMYGLPRALGILALLAVAATATRVTM
ncbi:MAG: hypothetical protein GSR84_08295 [Desulfurococcales archaeon]|nr:hypothetical protein [Desulfurococcales archaeon]